MALGPFTGRLLIILVIAALAGAVWLAIERHFGFAPLGLPRLAEAAGAAAACIMVNDLIGIIWRWLAAKVERAPRPVD